MYSSAKVVKICVSANLFNSNQPHCRKNHAFPMFNSMLSACPCSVDGLLLACSSPVVSQFFKVVGFGVYTLCHCMQILDLWH